MRASGAVPQVEYVDVHEQRWRAGAQQVLAEIAELGLPVFVKPAHLGSSVGIVKVTRSSALEHALEEAFAHDGLAIVEATAVGVEVECGALGLLGGERAGAADAARGSPPGEIVLRGEWDDYPAKDTAGRMDLQVPGGHPPS